MLREFRAQAAIAGTCPTPPLPAQPGGSGSRRPTPERRAPVPSRPTETDLETARSFHRLACSQEAIEPERVCRGRLVCPRKSLDRYARPSVMQPACAHHIASIPPPYTSEFAIAVFEPAATPVGRQRADPYVWRTPRGPRLTIQGILAHSVRWGSLRW